MVSKTTNSHNNSSFSKRKTFLICLLSLSLTFLALAVLSLRDPKPTDVVYDDDNTVAATLSTTRRLHKDDDDENDEEEDDVTVPAAKHPPWLKVLIEKKLKTVDNGIIRVGLINSEAEDRESLRGPHVETVQVRFDSAGAKWEELFPEWIDEDAKWAPPKCPEIPLPSESETEYDGLDVVVARVPCANGTRRHVAALQVNLAAASLAARGNRDVHVAFVGECGPMGEIFRCEDLLMQRKGEFWLYRPMISRLEEKLLTPVGSCQLARPIPRRSLSGKKATITEKRSNMSRKGRWGPTRYAYVTILHSSESYVCGAVALAHSLRRTNTTHDLVLLADSSSIGPKAVSALRSAGWKIVPIQRIRSPFAARDSYNEWNYSKLRIFQLSLYSKLVFIDSDLIVLRNLDHLMSYPSLSAAPNDNSLFNSGLMVIEPSPCLFEEMMRKSFEIVSYNGGDQGFLNEIFVWWHRLPANTNHLKVYASADPDRRRDDVAAVHYLGLKPWTCYRDYDCNWDMADRHLFASDHAHRKWWEVYDSMPVKLQRHCGLTKKMDWRIRKWRKIAMDKNLTDGHWKIVPKDPRRRHFVD